MEDDPMSRNGNVAIFVGAFLVVAAISISAVARGEKSEMATTRLAYSQVFRDPMNATCPNPTRRKVKTSAGYKWRWVC
jgi:hypothetical protein